MSKVEELNYPARCLGDELEEIRWEIKGIDALLEDLRSQRDGKLPNGVVRSAAAMRLAYLNSSIDDAVDRRRDFKEQESILLGKQDVPEKIICPHCGYDGEFDIAEPVHGGFRALEPVLVPRIVMGYGNGSIQLSDVDRSFDCFDAIADPSPSQDHLWDKEDSIQMKWRSFLKGKWIFDCGHCLKWFELPAVVAQCQSIYDGEDPYESKWRRFGVGMVGNDAR